MQTIRMCLAPIEDVLAYESDNLGSAGHQRIFIIVGG